MVDPIHVHLVAAKDVMRCLKSMLEYGLRYASNGKIRLHRFADSGWERRSEDRKSTSRCCFSLGSGMISWYSRKQSSVALNTAEAEYIVACLASSETVWIHKFLTGFFNTNMDVTHI